MNEIYYNRQNYFFCMVFFYYYKLINVIKYMYLFVKLYILGFGGKLEKLVYLVYKK